MPVPMLAAQRIDLAIQSAGLLHGRLAGSILIDQPELTFTDIGSDKSSPGASGPWLGTIANLFPFKINRAIIRNGSLHFRSNKAERSVDIYLSQLQATIDNLGNIRDEFKPLAATVQARSFAMDQAEVQFNMALDPFSYRPTFHMATRLLGLDVTKLNDLALAYGKFDFKRGWLDLVIEADATEGQLSGYVKPLFRDLKIFSLREDLKDGNVLQAFRQALLGAVTTVLKNPPRDQFGTLIPFSGDLSQSTTADILATVVNILHNAFVRAYLPRLESGEESIEGLQFGAPDFTTAISIGDTQ